MQVSIITSEHDGFNIKGAGGICTTVEDLKIWEEKKAEIISENGLRKIRTPYSKNGYGYGIQILNQYNQTCFLHAGGLDGYISYMLHLEKDKINVIILSNFGDIALVQIINDLNSILFGEPYELPKEINRVAICVNTEVYNKFIGDYQMEEDETKKCRMLIEDKRLFMIDPFNEKRELFPETELVYFFNPDSEESVEFVLDDQNDVRFFNYVILGGIKLKVNKIK